MPRRRTPAWVPLVIGGLVLGAILLVRDLSDPRSSRVRQFLGAEPSPMGADPLVERLRDVRVPRRGTLLPR